MEQQLTVRQQLEKQIEELEKRITNMPDNQVEERIELRKKLIKIRAKYGLTINI